MIIKTRNTLLLTMTFISLFLLIGMGILAFFQFNYGNIITDFPENQLTDSVFFLKDNLIAVFASIFYLLLYVTAFLFLIYVQFEKTQSLEIIYFSLFLTSLLFETSRLFIPCFDLWDSYTNLNIIISRFVLFGRLLAPLSLLFSAIQNLPEHRQNTERNLLILIVCSAIFASIFPVNSEKLLYSCRLKFGFENTLIVIWIVISIITFISQIMSCINANQKSLIPVGFALLAFGYPVLYSSTTYLALTFGIVLTITGTLIFLQALHKQYLWN